MDAAKIESLANELASVAAIFAPGSATAIGLLLKTGAALNGLIADIKAQTEADAPEVWQKVEDDFSHAVEAWQDSLNG